jgi:pantetheine-phosphate adenylyltransferase
MAERLAVCPGSFDPLTNGHVDIVRRAARLFDRVVVAILVNPDKAPLFSTEERAAFARGAFADQPNVEVEAFSGLLVDYARRRGACAIVRGLRAVADFDFEFQRALMNRRLNPDVDSVFLAPADGLTFISSRLVKEVCRLGGDIEGLVPAAVAGPLRERLAARPS